MGGLCSLLNNILSGVSVSSWAEFLDETLLVIQSPLKLCLAISISSTHATSYSFVKEKGGKPDRKP